ncbi:type II toxin-antitoxin system YafQ family toxin [Glaciimonas sp. Gout2]|uniref:type II toxin-antitoxin system RelE/ParE family toxin n=1 Tax=unclassified Glaciimonas TaxID=2644401 RepID=UPI002B22DDE1|nr:MULTISPECIES: type II toxin-antitoxin system YafQ family toxin [unclassified Glaciimonas]MEB0010932.1 type II toxin-antitoxin system YafQ family toxin [Glaciimonas sp. Cout2]MEB0081714.1 type II toxin-antitoxin system YafQ family toxin [Glaciimonas sp. Gout2]
MRVPKYSGQFKLDVKQAEKRGKDMQKLRDVITLILSGDTLPRELGDHPLKGEWKPNRDLHIEPDWVLIYTPNAEAVYFERTGTHSDIFSK